MFYFYLFFKITDPYIGRSFFLCSHDPIFGTIKKSDPLNLIVCTGLKIFKLIRSPLETEIFRTLLDDISYAPQFCQILHRIQIFGSKFEYKDLHFGGQIRTRSWTFWGYFEKNGHLKICFRENSSLWYKSWRFP